MASIEAEIRALLDNWSEAIRAKDIERLMALYPDDVVYFNVVPPLQIIGATAVRNNFVRWFDGWSSTIGQEIRDLSISASVDIAIAFMLIRASGTQKDGREVGYWVRETVACRRSARGWLITHEHVSLPIDFRSGRALMDLEPPPA